MDDFDVQDENSVHKLQFEEGQDSDLQEQRRTVESELQKNGAARLQCMLLRERQPVMEWSNLAQNQRMRNNEYDEVVGQHNAVQRSVA